MKKTKYYAWMMAAALAMTGCSDEIDTGGENGGATIEGVDGYVKVAINLPTADINTRAANDDFEDGLPDEYKVNGGVLAFYTASSSVDADANAIFVRAYTLSDANFGAWVDVNDNVTTKSILIHEAPMPTEGNSMYALVVLNQNGIVSVTESDGTMTVGSTTISSTSNNKLSDLQKSITAAAGNSITVDGFIKNEAGSASFLMSNSPLVDASGNYVVNITETPSVGLHTLTKVDVYETEDDANAVQNPNQIYVERAVAKVTMTGWKKTEGTNGGDDTYSIDVSGTNSLYDEGKVVLQGWVLDVTNNSTSLVRDVDAANITSWISYDTPTGLTGSATNRFFSNSPLAAGGTVTTPFYRTYWAETSHDSYVATNYTIYTEQTFPSTANKATDDDDVSHPLYCFENAITAAQAASTNNIETRVLIKATYFIDPNQSEGTDFFVIGGARDQGCLTETEFINWIEKATSVTSGTYTVSTSATAGTYKDVDGIKTLFGLTGTDADNTAQSILDKTGEIMYFVNGDTYYEAARIEHFGPYYTIDPTGDATVTEANSLGYYGVIRNNWYEIHINSINGPGEPTPPTDKPSGKEGYMNAQINVLSWAKRAQSVDL